ncbi:hypothetical protein MHY85_06015 [Cellulomonas sp. ACRRI]|uniref:hypothetical protein n=1 Tax=Cellulomonas sp. ACRRI TaxID=2918188 RepID=UPI001EF388BF|nr:hypothetical protein [Cellulomonas sp. ACRRI]MCG7285533.1 hypothetical protein [Cellulomonas sp. ACRRI]
MTDETHPDLPGLTRAASDIISVRRVFGEPYELGGTLVVPVAKVLGWHGVAGAHADARLGVRGGHGGHGGPGQGGSGSGGTDAGGTDAGGTGDEGPDGQRGPSAEGAPGAGGPAPDAGQDAGHGAHAGSPAPEDGPWARSGPVAWAGPGGDRPHGPGRGGWHGGLGRGPLLRGPLWPFGAGRPGGRGVGAADAGGYATRVKPLGVFVVDDEGAHWQPALDLNRIILGGQVVGAVATVALAWALRRRRR